MRLLESEKTYNEIYAEVFDKTDGFKQDSGVLVFDNLHDCVLGKDILETHYSETEIKTLKEDSDYDLKYHVVYSNSLEESRKKKKQKGIVFPLTNFDDDSDGLKMLKNPAGGIDNFNKAAAGDAPSSGSTGGSGPMAAGGGMGESLLREYEEDSFERYQSQYKTPEWLTSKVHDLKQRLDANFGYFDSIGIGPLMFSGDENNIHADFFGSNLDPKREEAKIVSFLKSKGVKNIDVYQNYVDDYKGEPYLRINLNGRIDEGISESKLNEVYPRKGESKKDFISRFMSATKKEYPDQKQRFAVANSYWERRDLKEEIKKNNELNPDIFENNEMKPEVKEKLQEIVEFFKKSLEENDIKLDIKDVLVVGSNASYNYTDKSDIDLHIMADLSIYPDQEELAEKLYLAHKSLFNNKYGPTIYGHPVEVYVEPYKED